MSEQASNDKAGATGTQSPRRRLRVQPLASDAFSTLAYACITALLFCEFLALFWLDIF